MTHFSIVAESENPLIPATYDILWGTISFFVVLFVFWKFVLPTFTRVANERQEKIEGGIEKAKVMQAEAERSREAYAAQLEGAAKEASAIRTSAHSDGDQIVNAVTSAVGHGIPSENAAAASATVVSATCTPPAPKTA